MEPTTISRTSAAWVSEARMKKSPRHISINSREARRAFTLVELLIVIGIIIILASLLLVGVVRARRNASKLRTQADFQTISIALEAYKTDFGDYPRPDSADTGAAILGRALLGPYGNGKIDTNNAIDQNDPIQYNAQRPYKPGDCVSYSNQMYVMVADSNGALIPPND